MGRKEICREGRKEEEERREKWERELRKRQWQGRERNGRDRRDVKGCVLAQGQTKLKSSIQVWKPMLCPLLLTASSHEYTWVLFTQNECHGHAESRCYFLQKDTKPHHNAARHISRCRFHNPQLETCNCFSLMKPLPGNTHLSSL